MLRYTIIFIIIALIAGFLGFASLEGTAALVAKVCFVLFLIFTGSLLYAGDQRWHTVEGGDSIKNLSGDLRFPEAFRQKLHDITHPGTTMVVTSEPISTRGGTSRGVMGGE